MKRITSWLLTLVLVLSIGAGAFASTPETAGPPVFDVSTVITPDLLTVYQGGWVEFTAVTKFTSNKSDNQWLHFVSDAWIGVDASDPAAETPIEVNAEPAADPNERQQVFTATASVLVSNEPGEYDVYVTYTITLQHDFSGLRTDTAYNTVTTSVVIAIDVLEGTAVAELIDIIPTQDGLLNHGQIVSAWAHWKQTKGNETFLAGGPGVYRSLVWYKTQVEYKEFTSVQQVYDYLDDIYEPENRHVKNDKQDKEKKDNPNSNKDKDKPKKGN